MAAALCLICWAAPMSTSADDVERIARVIQPTTDFSKAEKFELMQGGAGTSRKRINTNAFSHSAANLKFEDELTFKLGNAMFRRLWVSAPASTQANDGLGPLFNARSCQRCHLKDGRGHPPAANAPEDNAVSMLVRVSIPPQTDEHRKALTERRVGTINEPTYGEQIQDFALPGIDPEANIHITYEEMPVVLGDGTTVNLRKPTYKLVNLRYGALHPDTMLSPRIANPMIGLGLLELISAERLKALSDPDDQDGDGISGKIKWVRDAHTGELAIGRFGWKAGTPTVEQQTAAAFNGDIGISTLLKPTHWGDCTDAQTDCRNAHHGDSPQYEDVEAGLDVMRLVSFYSSNLAVPARRDVSDPAVLRGKQVFYESGCIGCHTPKHVTATDSDRPALSRQLIWPYTDLLLHDMGEGLADDRPEGDATGREWRTAPLWGIGLTETVSGHTNFLHDGRARNLLEAILWHGGEAEAAKENVRITPKADREALIKFLESL